MFQGVWNFKFVNYNLADIIGICWMNDLPQTSKGCISLSVLGLS